MGTSELRDPAAPAPFGKRELRAVAVGNAYRVDVENERFSWTLDESSEEGGTDSGPSPVQALLGALLSCFTISFQFSARRKSVPIDRIDGWIVANEEKYITEIALELQVWSPAPEADVRALLERAERGCYVRNTLKPEIAFSVDLVVSGPYEG
jgi:uncharacterized OsmC-like protein